MLSSDSNMLDNEYEFYKAQMIGKEKKKLLHFPFPAIFIHFQYKMFL